MVDSRYDWIQRLHLHHRAVVLYPARRYWYVQIIRYMEAEPSRENYRRNFLYVLWLQCWTPATLQLDKRCSIPAMVLVELSRVA